MKVEYNLDFSTGACNFRITTEDRYEEMIISEPGTTNTIMDEIVTMMLEKEPAHLREHIKDNLILSLITGFYKDISVDIPRLNSTAYKAIFNAIDLWKKEFMGGENNERA